MSTVFMKVFLSSTYEDLREHRAKAAQAIERLGQRGIRMEAFGARADEPTTACLEEIESSDAFLGIYAHRYGYVPTDSPVSITEQEFNFAQEKKKPAFCFFVDDDYAWLPRHIEPEPGQSKLKAFKDRIKTRVVRDTFTTPEDLAFKVSTSLGYFLITRDVTKVRPQEALQGTPEALPEIHSIPPPTASPREIYGAEYSRTSRLFLVHILERSTKNLRPDRPTYDVTIFVMRHVWGPSQNQTIGFDEIEQAEFYLGPSWGDEPFPVLPNKHGSIALRTSAWGRFLAMCRVTFKDKDRAL